MSDRREAGAREQELGEEQAEQKEQEEREEQGPVVRDKRRVDPETGQVREPAETPAPPASPETGEAGEPMTGQIVSEETVEGDTAGSTAATGAPASGDPAELAEQVATLQAQLSSAVADTQRVQAEYANYRKRVDRDREAVREQALVNVLTDLLPVLDDIGRAREHGELQGGFRQVAESLEQIVTKLGMVRFGEAGDAFDPTIHEAMMHSYSDEVTETTCAQILQPGYAVNDRVLRPARVAVAEPETHSASQQPGSEETGSETAPGAGGAEGAEES